MPIPTIPFVIETIARLGVSGIRHEKRNATTLPQAMELAERELAKPHTRKVRVNMIIYEADRRGGIEDVS